MIGKSAAITRSTLNKSSSWLRVFWEFPKSEWWSIRITSMEFWMLQHKTTIHTFFSLRISSMEYLELPWCWSRGWREGCLVKGLQPEDLLSVYEDLQRLRDHRLNLNEDNCAFLNVNPAWIKHDFYHPRLQNAFSPWHQSDRDWTWVLFVDWTTLQHISIRQELYTWIFAVLNERSRGYQLLEAATVFLTSKAILIQCHLF